MTLIPDLPDIPGVMQEPLYRAEAHGLELSEDVLQTNDYLAWFFIAAYVHPTSASC